MDKKKQLECIAQHQMQITKILEQMEQVKRNHTANVNHFLPTEINNKLLQHELLQLEEEKKLHDMCVICLEKKEHIPLVSDFQFNNAKKKKLLKLAKKIDFNI